MASGLSRGRRRRQHDHEHEAIRAEEDHGTSQGAWSYGCTITPSTTG